MPVLNAQYYGKIDLHYINMFMFVIIVKIIENAWLCVARENERSQGKFLLYNIYHFKDID